MAERPSYAVQSVDHALRIIQALRDRGDLRVVEVARDLGVATSTAHRLLAMLVYRGFAVQDESRVYHPGPELTGGPGALTHPQLRRLLGPHVRRLSALVNESVNLIVRVGTSTRFLDSVEADQLLRVSDRNGYVLPAALTSGGRALLATLPTSAVRELYPGDEAAGVPLTRLLRILRATRQAGYALNREETEKGVSALAAAVYDERGHGVAALAIAVPSVRFSPARTLELVGALRDETQRANQTLARADQPGAD